MKYFALIYRDDEHYIAYIPDYPYLKIRGASLNEAHSNARFTLDVFINTRGSKKVKPRTLGELECHIREFTESVGSCLIVELDIK